MPSWYLFAPHEGRVLKAGLPVGTLPPTVGICEKGDRAVALGMLDFVATYRRRFCGFLPRFCPRYAPETDRQRKPAWSAAETRAE